MTEEPGSGAAFARALGLISSRPTIAAFADVHAAVIRGQSVRITAERAKFDADGNQIDKDGAGEYVTLGYAAALDDGEEWVINREPEWEGEPSALAVADAFGEEADRDFCEALVQAKCLLDRIGGQLFLRPYMRDGQALGVLAHYEHITSGETNASLAEPIQLPGASGPRDGSGAVVPPEEPAADSQPSTPEAEHAAIAAERA